MESAELVRALCKTMDISISELAKRLNQTPQNLAQKMRRGTLKYQEMNAIAETLGVSYEHRFIVPVSNLNNDKLSEELSVSCDKKNYVRSDAEMLISVICDVFPFICTVNLSKNTYRVMECSYWETEILKELGTYEEAIEKTVKTIPSLKFKQIFQQAFSRKALLKAYKKGIKKVQLKYQQVYLDRQIHWTETVAFFIPDYDGDVKAIVFCRNIDQEMKKEEEIKLIGNIPGGAHICYLTPPIHLEYISISMANLLGYGYQEIKDIMGPQYARLIVEQDRETFDNFIEKLSKEEMTDTCFYRMIKKDGKIIYVSDTMQSVRCLDGVMRGYSIVTDITSQVEESIKKEKYYNHLENQLLNFQTALINSSYGYLFADLTHNEIIGDITVVNKQGKEMKLYDPVLGSPIKYDDFERWWAKNNLVSNERDFLKQSNCEYLINQYYNGKRQITVYCVAKDSNNEIYHFQQKYFFSKEKDSVVAFCIVDDVTEDVKKNEEIRQLLQENDELTKISEVLSTLYGVVYAIEADTGKYRVYNKTQNQKFNFVKKGENFFDMAFNKINRDVEKKDQALIKRMIMAIQTNEVLKKSAIVSFVYRRRGQNGELKYFRMKILKVKQNNKELYLLLDRCVDDSVKSKLIHEEKRRRQYRKYFNNLKALKDRIETLSNAKTQFLFNMSHEIRTPLTAVLGFAEMAKKTLPEDNIACQYIRQIENSGKILLSMLNEIFDIVKIERNMEVEDVKETININDLCDEVIAIVKMNNKGKDLYLKFKADCVINEMITANKGNLFRILFNVFDNAMKYTPNDGHIAMEVKEITSDKPGCSKYIFTCEDDGIGIHPETLAQIYDPFVREQTSTQSGIKGMGLGLTLTKKIVDRLGGEIKVESTLGEGTKVTVSIELEVKKAIKKVTPIMQEGLLRGKHFLVVDDNEINAMIEENLISEWGATSKSVNGGIVAVTELENQKEAEYDAVLMDIQMPDMDGLETTQHIRKLKNKKIAGIPIIAVSANTFADVKEKAREVGMNGFVCKPIDSYQLYESICKSLLKENESCIETMN